MDEFFFKCHACGKEIKGHKKFIGMEASCPHCSESIVVRPEEEKPQQLQPQPPPPMEQPQNSPPAPVLKRCPACQREMSSLAQLCPHCGQPNNDAPSQRSRFAYMLLGLLFGGLGIHNFYADQYWGFGHIMLSVGFVFALQGSRSWLGVIVTILMCAVQMIWILFEIIFCKKDGKGVPFK